MTATSTPCQANPTLWDVDTRMPGHEIKACIDLCLSECHMLAACRRLLADMDANGVTLHGVVAGEFRPWPHSKPGRPVRNWMCAKCHRFCVSRSAKAHNPLLYESTPYRAPNGLCNDCFVPRYRSQGTA